MQVTVNWPVDRGPGHPPHVSLAVKLEAIQLQLRPPDVAGMLALARGFATAQAAAAAAAAQLPAPAKAQAAEAQATLVAGGHHSFIDDLMLPECEGLVQDAVADSVATSITGQVGAPSQGRRYLAVRGGRCVPHVAAGAARGRPDTHSHPAGGCAVACTKRLETRRSGCCPAPASGGRGRVL